MAYIETFNNRLTCTHPKVSKIHEWGGVSLDLQRTAHRFITLTMSDGKEKIFRDYGEGEAVKEAEMYLQNECKVV